MLLLLVNDGHFSGLLVGLEAVLRHRDQDPLLGVEPVQLVVALRKLAHDVIDVAMNRLVELAGLGFGHVHPHFALFEEDPVAEHLGRQVLIEIPVSALRVLGVADGVGDVRRTVRLGEEVVFALSWPLIRTAQHHVCESVYAP